MTFAGPVNSPANTMLHSASVVNTTINPYMAIFFVELRTFRPSAAERAKPPNGGPSRLC